MIKFNKHHVTDGTIKARCHYSLDNRCDAQKCVTIYAKDYTGELGKLFAGSYKNDTDLMTDYFDKGRVTLFAGDPMYAAARARAESNKADDAIAAAARQAKWSAATQAADIAYAQACAARRIAAKRGA
jgi:hypothetical protein